MSREEERNFCPDCGELVPLGAARCPHCRRIFHPGCNNWWALWLQCWRLGFTFSGRAPLVEFYAFMIPQLLLTVWGFFYMTNGVGVRIMGGGLCSRVWDAICSDAYLSALAVYLLVSLVPTIALFSRRAHDFGIGVVDFPAESERYDADTQDGCLDWWWRIRCLFSGPLGWLFILFERLFHRLFTCCLTFFCILVRSWYEDSLPGPNEYGPGTRHPRFHDAPVDDEPFRD